MQVNNVVLRSKHNPFIKDIIRLKQKRVREARGLFMFEGEKLFLEATAWSVDISDIILSETCYQKKVSVYQQAHKEATRCTIVSDAVYAYLSEQKHPEGVLCIAKRPVETLTSPNGNSLILDGIRDPGNLGTMIRTADAAGFGTVYCLENTVDPYNEKTIRAAMGSTFHIVIREKQNAMSLLNALKAKDIVICAASLNGESSLTVPVNNNGAIALVIGNESHGIRPEIESQCDICWRLPIYGHAESLNAAVAAGILMYEIVRTQKLNNKSVEEDL